MRLLTTSRSYDFVFHRGLDDWLDSVKERLNGAESPAVRVGEGA